jgi:hypothetical protein
MSVANLIGTTSYKKTHFKIILTTDQELIKDGVQVIDDEFLKWFVKNPSCEDIEISYGLLKPFQSNYTGYIIHLPDTDVLEEPKLINNCPKCGLDLVEREGSKPVCTRIDCGGIILSNESLKEFATKEEPKQDEHYLDSYGCTKNEFELSLNFKKEKQKQHLIDMMKGDAELGLYDDWVKDAEKESNLSDLNDRANAFWSGYRAGVKSKERSYSEEEVRKLLETQRGNCYVAILTKTKDKELAAIAGGAPEPSGYNGWVK